MHNLGDWKTSLRVLYALRQVPDKMHSLLLPRPETPMAGDIVLARVERIGRNASLELRDGRRCSLHRGDLLAVVFGNRYATQQFEGYARAEGDYCDLLSMGGLCGLVESKHAECGEPTRLHLLGSIADSGGHALRLRQFAMRPVPLNGHPSPRTVVVCVSSMDAGKTTAAVSIIKGLHKHGHRVVAAKLTGTAAGRDTWQMLDSGACQALDFVDGGLPSTYLCSLEELLDLHSLFIAVAAFQNAACLTITSRGTQRISEPTRCVRPQLLGLLSGLLTNSSESLQVSSGSPLRCGFSSTRLGLYESAQRDIKTLSRKPPTLGSRSGVLFAVVPK